MAIDPRLIALYERGVVNHATLLVFDFSTEVQRFTLSGDPVVTNGFTYQPTGGIIGISPLERLSGTAAAKQEIYVSPKETAWRDRVMGSPSTYKGRKLLILRQPMDENRQPVGLPMVRFPGIMHSIGYVSGTAKELLMVLTAETLMAQTRIIPNAYLTDADIQAKTPGDLGGQFVASHINKKVRGPVAV